MALEDDVRARKIALGLPDTATMEEMQAATISRVRQNVGQPGRPSIRFIPAPSEAEGKTHTIRVSTPISSVDSAEASITEDGENKQIAQLRFLLSKLIVGQLMQGRWVSVWIEGNEAHAALHVAKPG